MTSRGRGRRKYFTLAQQSEARLRYERKHRCYFAGITAAGLAEMFKCDVFHKPGRGFYWYPAKPKVQ